MPFDRSLVEGPYLRDILAQPQALADTAAALCRAAAPPDVAGCERIVLTGMGASYHALHPLLIRLVAHGIPAVAYETSELLYYYEGALTSRTLLIAVSQSGQSVEMVRLLDIAAGRMPIVSVTNTPDSPLATRADFTVLTEAGAESSVSCKTFVSALLALEWLGAALTGAGRTSVESVLPQAAPAFEAYLAGWESKVADLMAELAGVQSLFVAGRGPSMAAAGNGGLILKESAHFHAEGMTCSAFRHGPFETCGPEIFVLVMAGDPKTAALNAKLVRDVRAAGGRAALASPDSDVAAFRIPETAAPIRPIVEILPLQMISLALAALKNHQPGKFCLLTKVTTVE